MSLENATSATMSATPMRRPRLRFGLRGLIVAVTLAAIMFAMLGVSTRQRQRQRDAIEKLKLLGAIVVLPHEKPVHPWLDIRPLRYSDILFDTATGRELSDTDMRRLVAALDKVGAVDRLVIESSVLTDAGLVRLKDVLSAKVLELRCPMVTSRGTDALQQKFPKLVILDD
jgi:hypothetical protein